MDSVAGICLLVAAVVILGSDGKRWRAAAAGTTLWWGVSLAAAGSVCPLFLAAGGDREWIVVGGVATFLGIVTTLAGVFKAKNGVGKSLDR